MRSLRWLAAGAVGLAAAGSADRAFAFPTSAYTSNEMPYNRAACLNRAAQAMAAGGWAARPSAGIGLLGHKEPSSAYILCLDVPNASPTTGAVSSGTVVVVFVASTSPDVALPVDEASRLQQFMIQPAR